MQGQFITQHLLDGGDHDRVVVPQRQSPGTGQAIDKSATLDVFNVQTLGPLEGQRQAPRVTARIGLLTALAGQQRRLFKLVQRFKRMIFSKASSD